MLTNTHDAFTGQSRSPNMVPFDMLGVVSYWCSIVTMSLKHTIFEILDFEKVMTLISGPKVTQGHRNRHGSIRYL